MYSTVELVAKPQRNEFISPAKTTTMHDGFAISPKRVARKKIFSFCNTTYRITKERVHLKLIPNKQFQTSLQ